MKIDEMITETRAAATARTVYAEPCEQDGITVIPAASVAGGGGGGTGRDKAGQQGEGGGFGLGARPTGAFVIKDGDVRWQPAVDVNRLVTTITVAVVSSLLLASRIARTVSKSRARSGADEIVTKEQ